MEEDQLKRELIGRNKSSLTSSDSHSIPSKGIDLSSSSGMPFPLQNSFAKGTLIGREDGFSPEAQINTSRGMMMMLNCEDGTDDNMTVDEENNGYVEG